MAVVLYWMAVSHPSAAARKMLDLKHVEYKLVKVFPLNQRLHLRLAGFRSGTVPALKLDGRKIHGMLARIDHLLADGTLALDPPNAATLQILVTVRLLDGFEDLRDLVRAHACAEPARDLFPEYRAKMPHFLDPAWLTPIGTQRV